MEVKPFAKLIVVFFNQCIEWLAWFLSKVLSPQRAYAVILRSTRFFCPIARCFNQIVYKDVRKSRDIHRLLFQKMLCAYTRYGKLELHLRVVNEDKFFFYHHTFGRVILCTAHFGFTMAVFSFLEKKDLRAVTISDGGPTGRAFGWNWGCLHPINLIKLGPQAFVKARRSLLAGEVLIVYADYCLPGSEGGSVVGISPNVFEFAKRTGTHILFLGSVLAPDGAIELEFVQPSFSLLESQDAVTQVLQEFSEFVESRTGKTSRLQKVPLV